MEDEDEMLGEKPKEYLVKVKKTKKKNENTFLMGLVNFLKQQLRDKDDFKKKEKGASHEVQSTKFKSKTVKQEPDVKDECIIDDTHRQIFQNSELMGGA